MLKNKILFATILSLVFPFVIFAEDKPGSTTSTSQPIYYQTKGPLKSIIKSVTCGDKYEFDVTGYSGKNVWVQQYKDNKKVFDGFIAVPMSTYTSECNKDEGKYYTVIYNDDPNSSLTKNLQYIGFTEFTISPATFTVTPSLELRSPGVFVLRTDQNHDVVRSGYFNETAAATDLFKKYRDEMDVVVFVPSRSLMNATNYPCNCAWGVRKLIDGIGYPFDGYSSQFINELSPVGRFYSFALVPAINDVGNYNKSTDSAMYVLLHEIGHAWSTFISRGTEYPPNNPLKILEEWQYAHWGYISDNFNSVMAYGPARIKETENGFFEPIWTDRFDSIFNDFDLYAMGVMPPDKVKPTFVVQNPFGDSSQKYEKFRGVKRSVTIQDSLKIEGKRVPSYGISKNNTTNNVRVTFLIVQGPGGTANELTELEEKIKVLTDQLPSRWQEATQGLSTISVFTPSQKQQPKGFALSVERERSVEELRQEVEDILRRTHDDTMPLKRTIDEQKADFEKFIKGSKTTIQTTISTSSLAPTQTATLSLTSQLNQILTRLSVLQTELLNLIKLRAELLLR